MSRHLIGLAGLTGCLIAISGCNPPVLEKKYGEDKVSAKTTAETKDGEKKDAGASAADVAKTTEGNPAPTKPVDATPAKPDEGKPADSKPSETTPANTKAAETKPAEAKPDAPQPTTDTKPTTETKPADAKPAESKPSDPAVAEATGNEKPIDGDYTQWASTPHKNNIRAGKNIPTDWAIGKIDRKTGKLIPGSRKNSSVIRATMTWA
jgi:hypothetical protein